MQEVGGGSVEIALGDFTRETLRVSLEANFVRLRSRRTRRSDALGHFATATVCVRDVGGIKLKETRVHHPRLININFIFLFRSPRGVTFAGAQKVNKTR